MATRVERTIESLEDTARVLQGLLSDGPGPSGGAGVKQEDLQRDLIKRLTEEKDSEIEKLKAENDKLRVRVAILCRALDARDRK